MKVTIETPEGIVVRTVSNGQLQAGAQSVTWDGRAGNRKPVAGGAYVAKVTATNELGAVSLTQPLTVRRVRALARLRQYSLRRARRLHPQRAERRHHVVHRRLRPLRDLLPHADRRGSAGRERARHGVRRRTRRGSVREPGRHALRAHDRRGPPAYLAVALAGTIGYTIGSIGGWAIGLYGGRPYLERHGRWLHLNEAKLDRAERWFERWEDWAVFLGRLTPVVRSFVSIPAGVFETPFVRYTLLTLARVGDLVLRVRRRGLRRRRGVGGLPPCVPLRRVRRRRGDRRGSGLARLAVRQAPQARVAEESSGA